MRFRSLPFAAGLIVLPCSFARTVKYWVRWFRDLALIFRPALVVFVPVVVLAFAMSKDLVPLPF